MKCTMPAGARTVKIASLKADPANLRTHGVRSIDAIAASLARFGQQRPILVDEAGVVIAGNGTLEAARRLGWKTISVVRSKLAGPERVAYAIADNRIPELAGWDREALGRTLASFSREDLAVSGFDAADLSQLEAEQRKADREASIAVSEHPVARPGDLWTLGDHRLMCGDSTDAGDVAKLMGSDKAALVATDPPYLVDYTGEKAKGSGKDWSQLYREVEVKDADAFFRGLFAGVVAVASPGVAIYCWHAHKRAPLIVQVWEELGILYHQQIIWVKPSPVFGSVYWHYRHEPCLVGWIKGAKPPHDGRHDADSVWETPEGDDIDHLPRSELVRLLKEASSAWDVSWSGQSRPTGNEHPTQKPVELFARPMRKHTRPGDVVYEPFSGSGTQLVAAEQLGRRCRAMELEPVFVDVGIRRWQRLAGDEAVLASSRDGRSTGKTWAQVARARGVALDKPEPRAAKTPARKTARGTKK